MERKRTRLRLVSDDEEEEEEEEEENRDRRLSLRNRKRARYTEEDDEDEEEDQDEVEEEGEEDNEQPGPSTQNNHTQERFLNVTCGNKTGLLDKEKLYQAVKCIKCGDSWLSPSAFEDLGGKGANKKWKTSILYDKKPLKFWIDQCDLATRGFKKRGTETTGKMKIRSSNRISESCSEESEIQSAEETEEDDVKDEDWLPALVLETEEERVELGNNGEVVGSGVDKNKEEEDEVEKGEMEDEDMPAVDENDNSDVEGREAKSMISTPLREVKVVIRRLPEFQVQTNGLMEYPLKDSEDAQNEDERARNSSPVDDLSITASAQLDHSHMSDTSTIGGDEKENREDFTEDSAREEDEQRKIKTESSPTLSAPATVSQDIKPETKHIGSLADHTANLCASPVLVVTVTDTHLVDIKGDWEEGHCEEMEETEGKQTEMGPALFEDCENASDEHLNMSRSDATVQPFATGNIRDTTSPQTFIKEEISAAMDYDPPTTSPSLLVECKYEMTDATTSSHDTAELQVMLQETGVPQISQASDTTPSPDIVEAQSSGNSTSCDLDTMDLDQLRREKIKMQIRVLRLQEEYYTQKKKEQKK